MKITARQYAKAKKLLAEATQHQRTVRAWEAAQKQIGDQQIASITVEDDGTVKAELIVNGKSTAAENKSETTERRLG